MAVPISSLIEFLLCLQVNDFLLMELDFWFSEISFSERKPKILLVDHWELSLIKSLLQWELSLIKSLLLLPFHSSTLEHRLRMKQYQIYSELEHLHCLGESCASLARCYLTSTITTSSKIRPTLLSSYLYKFDGGIW